MTDWGLLKAHHRLLEDAGHGVSLDKTMDAPEPIISTERFAWQYAYTARLVFRRVPATPDQLHGLAEAAFIISKRQDPSTVADLTWLNWTSFAAD